MLKTTQSKLIASIYFTFSTFQADWFKPKIREILALTRQGYKTVLFWQMGHTVKMERNCREDCQSLAIWRRPCKHGFCCHMHALRTTLV